MRTALVVLAVGLLAACSSSTGPDEELVLRDFDRLLGSARPAGLYSIVSVGSGEGDSANVDRHVKFNVEPTQTRVVAEGLLTGLSLKTGESLSCGEAVLLYQRRDKAGWVLTRHELTQAPQAGAPRC